MPPRKRSAGRWALLLSVLAAGCPSDDGGSLPTTALTATTTTSASTTSSSTSTTTSDVARVEVFFLDEDAFNIGRPPFVRPVERDVPIAAPEQGALDALFAGPTAAEGASGLHFVASGASGFTDFRVVDGTAHVRLVGGCTSGGSTFTIADEIVATLRQFVGIEAVKIYDPDGGTEVPDDPGDSIPFCLEP
jgi:hypothetical protein